VVALGDEIAFVPGEFWVVVFGHDMEQQQIHKSVLIHQQSMGSHPIHIQQRYCHDEISLHLQQHQSEHGWNVGGSKNALCPEAFYL